MSDNYITSAFENAPNSIQSHGRTLKHERMSGVLHYWPRVRSCDCQWTDLRQARQIKDVHTCMLSREQSQASLPDLRTTGPLWTTSVKSHHEHHCFVASGEVCRWNDFKLCQPINSTRNVLKVFLVQHCLLDFGRLFAFISVTTTLAALANSRSKY